MIRIDICGLNDFAPGKPLSIVLHHADGNTESFKCKSYLQRTTNRVVQSRWCIKYYQNESKGLIK
jgi:hypothetical protein